MEQKEFFNSIREGNLEVVRKHLEGHPDLLMARDERGSTPLIMASYYDHRDMVMLLLEMGAPVDEKGIIPARLFNWRSGNEGEGMVGINPCRAPAQSCRPEWWR